MCIYIHMYIHDVYNMYIFIAYVLMNLCSQLLQNLPWKSRKYKKSQRWPGVHPAVTTVPQCDHILTPSPGADAESERQNGCSS